MFISIEFQILSKLRCWNMKYIKMIENRKNDELPKIQNWRYLDFLKFYWENRLRMVTQRRHIFYVLIEIESHGYENIYYRYRQQLIYH